MIPFKLEYYRPCNLDEAIKLYHRLILEDKKVKFYGGGTEIISMARVNNLHVDALIDYKDIPECNDLKIEDDVLKIGSALTLTKINESEMFPLMGRTLARIADHTIQNKITLGGNIAGSIIYRESVLPLLVSDCEIELVSIDGIRKVKFNDIFNKKIQLKEGELIVKVHIHKENLNLPSIHVKRTKNEKIDYPLITMVALENKNKLRFAFSGLCDYPFRSLNLEEIINDENLSIDDRLNKALERTKKEIITDISGSKEFRGFMFKEMIKNAIKELRG